MDDSKDLVAELQHRLQALNDKAAAYQRDLMAEFGKHMQDRLSTLPDHVAAQVSRAIAESMSKYPALRDLGSPPPLPTITDRTQWDGRRSPPPILYHTSGTPREGPRSPHEREEEFHGLFTPSYLPLLDGSERSMQSPPLSPTPATPPLLPVLPPPPQQQRDSAVTSTGAHHDHLAAAVADTTSPTATIANAALHDQHGPDGPKAPAMDLLQGPRPTPIRRLTDRSTSSVDSSGSEAKTRRSALRRTSSSAKGSPRRVRFDFQGMEVLPNSSPQASVILGQPPEAEPLPDTSAIVEEDESPAYTGISLLDVDGEEDALPQPKKVSSTQALRALSQQPLDAGTVWTVVNAESEEAVKMNDQEELVTQPQPTTQVSPAFTKAAASVFPSVPVAGSGGGQQAVGQHMSMHKETCLAEDDEVSDEDDFLSIGNKSPKRSQSPAARPPMLPSPSQQVPLPKANPTSPKAPDTTPVLGTTAAASASTSNPSEAVNDDEPMFEFEEDASRSSQTNLRAPQKYIKEEESDPSPLAVIKENAIPASSALVGSLPVRRRPLVVPMLAQSVGSYKGASLSFAPISNPDLYEEIANMKEVHFVVGSVDGRSGPDATDLGTYRATLTHLSGAPRSFTERLAFEEMMERRKAEDAEEAATRQPRPNED